MKKVMADSGFYFSTLTQCKMFLKKGIDSSSASGLNLKFYFQEWRNPVITESIVVMCNLWLSIEDNNSLAYLPNFFFLLVERNKTIQCFRIPISRYPGQVNFGWRKVWYLVTFFPRKLQFLKNPRTLLLFFLARYFSQCT